MTLVAVACGAAIVFRAGRAAADSHPADFDRDIRPILAGTCLRCHGGVRELAGLHLGQRDRATTADAKGRVAIVPGDPERSELVRRISRTGEGRMPPTGQPLSLKQIAAFRDWIARGAEWTPLWSLTKPTEAPLAIVRDVAWIKSPLDRFVLVKLEAASISPAPQADRATLLRRVSLDLSGIPPTIAEVTAFLADDSDDAYARVVDRLLASPRYGERWARVWLDLARFADTQGYEKDGRRTIWAYRDWIIGALNRDMPYDQLVTRQIAGDLLPDATDEDRIASAFHRNTLTNTEGGTDNEEFRMAAVLDRVAVTWNAFLGTTFQCVQCHSHPYDAFSQEEYYRFVAFFNQTEDADADDESPTISVRPPWWRERAIAAAALSSVEDEALNAWIGNATAAAEADATAASVPADLQPLLRKPASERDAGEVALLRLAASGSASATLASLAPTTVPIMRELPVDRRRTTHFLERGSLKKPGHEVQPDTPASMQPFPPEAPRNRLGLAQWITAADNPLFARVGVNRLWETLFGRGIVETVEDFGSQGASPDDRALLDHLARRFIDLRWSTKDLLREIVLSSTYQQASSTTAAALAKDPDNRMHSRAPRFRLEAETIRDSALAVSGLLSERMFGPSVMPPQPDGVWSIVYSDDHWMVSEGDDRYRRGLYTFWRRSSPYPSLLAFDAPSRETCTPRRSRSNSPLAALATLNDPAFLDAARGLASRAMERGNSDPPRIARDMLRIALVREPRDGETERLTRVYNAERERLSRDAEATRSLTNSDNVDLAAWMLVGNVVLNLDEFLTRG